MCIVDTSWSSNAKISKQSMMVNNSLGNNQVPAFTIVIVCVVHCRWYYWYVHSIHGTCTLRNIPSTLKTLNCSFRLSPVGKLMQTDWKVCTYNSSASFMYNHTHILCIELNQTDEILWDTVQYSDGVARIHKVIATSLSTDIGLLMFVFCFSISGCSLWHKYSKVCLLLLLCILKRK